MGLEASSLIPSVIFSKIVGISGRLAQFRPEDDLGQRTTILWMEPLAEVRAFRLEVYAIFRLFIEK
jgi:hypothetical protein